MTERPQASSAEALARMKSTRQRDTCAEVSLRKKLHARGLRFRVDVPVLPATRRRVDIAFGNGKVAVFVDGCFWHGCPVHGTWPEANAKWWADKILANQLRDRHTDRQLKSAGWSVVRVWEHEDPDDAADRIVATVRGRRRGGGS